MNIIDNRTKANETLERGAIVVAAVSGRQFLIIRDQLNSQYRLLDIERMETAYSFRTHEFTLEKIKGNFEIKEIIPAAEVSLVIGGTK